MSAWWIRMPATSATGTTLSTRWGLATWAPALRRRSISTGHSAHRDRDGSPGRRPVRPPARHASWHRGPHTRSWRPSRRPCCTAPAAADAHGLDGGPGELDRHVVSPVGSNVADDAQHQVLGRHPWGIRPLDDDAHALGHSQPDLAGGHHRAASVRPMPAAKAPNAPWLGVCESLPTISSPGRACPCSGSTWWQMPSPTSKKASIPWAAQTRASPCGSGHRSRWLPARRGRG
jgi:hypothetical protein